MIFYFISEIKTCRLIFYGEEFIYLKIITKKFLTTKKYFLITKKLTNIEFKYI